MAACVWQPGRWPYWRPALNQLSLTAACCFLLVLLESFVICKLSPKEKKNKQTVWIYTCWLLFYVFILHFLFLVFTGGLLAPPSLSPQRGMGTTYVLLSYSYDHIMAMNCKQTAPVLAIYGVRIVFTYMVHLGFCRRNCRLHFFTATILKYYFSSSLSTTINFNVAGRVQSNLDTKLKN